MSIRGNGSLLPIAALATLGLLAASPLQAAAGKDTSSQTAQASSAQKNAPSGTSSDAVKPGTGPTLSEKLDATNGVIKPPANVDPEMTQTPPKTGATMPVIPPSAVKPDTPAGTPKPEAK